MRFAVDSWLLASLLLLSVVVGTRA